MPPITADFTLTYEEFVESHQLQHRRKRFLAGPPQRSPWIGCGVIAALFLLTLVAVVVATYLTGRTITPAGAGGATYVQSDSPIVAFLWGMLMYVFVAGVFWVFMARSTMERRMLWRIVLLMIAIGAAVSLTSALTQNPPTPRGDDSATPAASLASFLPVLIGIAGLIFLIPMVRRGMMRVTWDGQPQLRRPVHLEATPQRLLVETPLSRHDYQWASFITYSEGPNVFVLSVSALTFQAVPKRAIAEAQLVEAFRALLRSRMVDADAKSQGFDVLPVQVPALSAVPLPPPPLQQHNLSEPHLPPGPSH